MFLIPWRGAGTINSRMGTPLLIIEEDGGPRLYGALQFVWAIVALYSIAPTGHCSSTISWGPIIYRGRTFM